MFFLPIDDRINPRTTPKPTSTAMQFGRGTSSVAVWSATRACFNVSLVGGDAADGASSPADAPAPRASVNTTSAVISALRPAAARRRPARGCPTSQLVSYTAAVVSRPTTCPGGTHVRRACKKRAPSRSPRRR